MNNIAMSGMNAAAAPVNAMPAGNNGTIAGPRVDQQQDGVIMKTLLHTYIYDYFLKNELYDCARALVQSGVPLNMTEPSPSQRRDNDGNTLNNGVEDTAMDTDTKEKVDSKRPDDLPLPKVPNQLPQNSFLNDWFCVFWDVFHAQRNMGKPGENGPAIQYLQHTQQQQRLRQEQNQHLLRQMNPMMPNQYQMLRMPNGMAVTQNELPRKAIANSRNATPHLAKTPQFMPHGMQREHSNVELNGDQRPQSPASAENAPSPSKRPRLENGPFNGHPMGPNARGQPPNMQGQPLPNNAAAAATGMHPNQLLMQHSITPNNLGQPQFNNFQQPNQVLQQQAAAMQKFAQNNPQHPRAQMANPNMPKGMPNAGPVPAQGSPMMAQVTEGAAMNNVNMNEYYAGTPAQMGMRSNGHTGANALHEYQVQLMLLEQHNKKRLIMARDEQDRTRPDGVMLHGQTPFQSMSPQVTRSGQSPTPQDQPKRGTPKMGQAGLPASPLPDGNVPKARGSPAAMGMHPGQVPPGMNPTFVQDMNDLKAGMPGVMPNGTMIRPPNSHPAAFGQHAIPPQQMEAYRQQAMRMQTQNWQQMQQGPGGPMMQQPHPPLPPPPPPPQQQPQQPQGQQPGQQPGQMETPQPRNAMPPPQAPPPANNGGNGRTQPSSPQPPQTAAPPTPQQSNKANPKAKKDAKETTRKRPAKKGSTTMLNAGATPSSEAEPPPTPTPSTPITPVHAQSFNAPKPPNQAQMTGVGNTQAPTSTPAPATQLAQPQPDPNHVAAFGPLDAGDGTQYNLEFAPLETGDVLGSFDFDAFLNDDATGANPMGFDINASSGYGNPDGVEAGTGEV